MIAQNKHIENFETFWVGKCVSFYLRADRETNAKSQTRLKIGRGENVIRHGKYANRVIGKRKYLVKLYKNQVTSIF